MFKKNSLKSHFDDELVNNVTQSKFIQERIKMVEKYVSELGKVLFNYLEKSVKTRDCIDKIALVLEDYAKAENVTTTFKLQISNFANVLIDVGTMRNAQVHAMETSFLEQLSSHEKICSQVQNELKVFTIAREKERNWERQLRRMRASQPQDHNQVSLVEEEFIKAKGEASKSRKCLEEHIDIFEKKRLNSIKRALLTWSLAELHFHAKALQLFTDAYRIADKIDVPLDMEEFRNKVRSAIDSPRSDVFQRSDSMLQLVSLPVRRKTKFIGSGIPHPCSAFNSPRSSRASNGQFYVK